MNNELVQSAFKGLLERLEKTEKFVLSQAPDICREMLVKANINSVYSMLFCASFFVLSMYARAYGWELFTDSDRDYKVGGGFMIGIGWVVTVVSAGSFFETIKNVIERTLCPKLFLIEEFKELLMPDTQDDQNKK